MAENLIESEAEQIRRFNALQKVALGILAKWKWLILLSFVVSYFSALAFLVWHSAKSVHRFSAETKLLYAPRKVEGFGSMDNKQLMSVLDRRSLKRKVREVVTMPLSEQECLSMDMEVVQSRKPDNIFTLKAQSGTWEGAVQKVNAYADILLKEYVAYRTRDLEMQREAIDRRKEKVRKQIAEIESEETLVKGKTGVAAPVEMLTAVNALLSDQRRNLSILGVQQANEGVRKKRLETDVGTVGPIVIANAPIIRKKSAEIAAVDAELTKLREVYTDLNPKVLGKLEERKLLLDDYSRFLKEKGIGNVAVEDIERIERAALELAEVTTKLDVINESHRSLEMEIKSNEARSEELSAAVVNLERLRSRREGYERTQKEVDGILESLSYLQISLNNDLQQIERAGGAGDKPPLRGKNFLFAAGGAFAVTFVVVFWILALELLFGKVRDSAEMTAWGDVIGLGSLPAPGAMKPADESDVHGVVALNLSNADVPKDVILVCRLPGAAEQEKFRESLGWSLAMAGRRAFLLNLVRNTEFTPPEGCETLLNTVYKDPHGWFTVENRYSLAPTELEMLKADIEELKKTYDAIFIMMPGGFCKGGSFFNQLLGACGSVLLLVGAGTTLRSDLSYVRRHALAGERPMMGMMVGASESAVRREMEAGK